MRADHHSIILSSDSHDAQGAFVGPLFDAIGPTILLIIGTFLMVFGHMMVSLCKVYYEFFLAQGVVIGAGGALVF